MRYAVHLLTAALLTMLGCTSSPSASSAPADPDLALSGGDTTIFAESFAYPARNLSSDGRGRFMSGHVIFKNNWMPAPVTTEGWEGLGPTFNGASCSSCHKKAGRAAPPQEEEDEEFSGLVLRLSVPGTGEHGGPKPEPTYGDQINQFGISGVPGEARPSVSYAEDPGEYGDGMEYSLRKPTYTIEMPAFGPLADDVLVGPRIAPQQMGLGLLQAVSESTLMKFAAENGGHPNRVWDEEKQTVALGRFGWKANQPSVSQQMFANARADVGITSQLFPTEDCPDAQTECADAPLSMTQPELDAFRSDSLLAHAMALAVPARRDLDDPMAQRGEVLFVEIGCASCHIPEMKTGTLEDWPELSKQTIRPFTDLLLHDMGPDLADDRPDFEASGSEWRTPPLWGLGLLETINHHQFLLHDGRARGFEEAILWHGGEAKQEREAFRRSPLVDREALVAFLSSL